MEMHLESTRDQRVNIPAAQLSLQFVSLETIHTENSYKFTGKSLVALLNDAGFAIKRTWTDPQRGMRSRSRACGDSSHFAPLFHPWKAERSPAFQASRSPGVAQIPVGADLARHGPQVVPEVDDRRPAPEPIAVIDAVDDESRLEHERVRNHRIMFRVGILRNVEILLNCSFGVGEEGPLGAHRCAELLESVVVIGGDRDNLGVCHRDLRIKRGKIQMLLVFFRAVVAARKRQDQGSSPWSSLSLRGVPV